MKLPATQQYLKDTGRYSGRIDDLWGMLTEGGILLAMTDGPDTPVTLADMTEVAKRIGVQVAAIRAFWKVEANGSGFQAGRPKILPEPHRFARATGGIFNDVAPLISYSKWGARPYAVGQDARYRILLDWAKLLHSRDMDLDAAFASASYGAPQIMGENAKLCGYPDAFSFAVAMARDERKQIDAFVSFVDKAGILPHLRKVDRTEASWYPVTSRYNGTAHKLNGYPPRIRSAFIGFGGR